MSGNATGLDILGPDLLKGLEDDSACCDVCGGHLPDHTWAALDWTGTVVACSEQTR